MEYKIKGTVKVVGELQQITSEFKKRELVVTTQDKKYPQDVSIEFTQDKTSKLDDVRVGNDVEVYFNIRGREYNGRYFVNLDGWKISTVGGSSIESQAPQEAIPSSSDISGDLPF